MATTNGGTTWRDQFTSRSPITDLFALNPQIGWAANSEELLGTTDGGQHWNQLTRVPAEFRQIDFVTPDVGWAVVGGSDPDDITGSLIPLHDGQLEQTVDGGRNWTRQVWPPTEGPADVQSVCFGDAKHGWFGTGATVWQTTGGGWEFEWQAPLSPFGGWYAQLGCAGPNVVWVLFVSEGAALSHKPYVFYRSANAGQQWTAIFAEAYTGSLYPTVRPREPEPGSYPGPFAVVSERILFFLGRSPAITGTFNLARTVDGGRSWKEHVVHPLAGMVPGPRGMAFVGGNHGWIVSSEANGEIILATADGGITWKRQYP